MITEKSVAMEIAFYENLCKQQERALRSMPAGDIYFKHQHKKWRPYIRNAGKEVYLAKKTKHKDISALTEKKLIEQSLKAMQNNIKHLKALQNGFTDFDRLHPSYIGQQMERTLGQGFEISEYLPEFRFSKSKSTREKEWLKQHGPLNPYKPEKRIHVTPGGAKLRSKSELIIGTFLETKNIPYKSDELLVVGGNEWYPDFKIKRPRDGRIIIWEHFGMMDDNDYAERNQEKLIIYMEYGFRLLDNLIVTHDENGTIDMATLEKLYQLVLK